MKVIILSLRGKYIHKNSYYYALNIIFSYSGDTSPVHLMRKYIVFEDCLMSLFSKCCKCGASTEVTKSMIGSFLHVKQYCVTCAATFEWDSQPFIQNIPAGNILLSSSILFCGALPSQILRVMQTLRCATITKRTFFKHQKKYLQASVLRVYRRHQATLFDEIKKHRRVLVIGGDGRADSPGHSAKYGSYTMMELEKKAIIDIQLVQVRINQTIKICLIIIMITYTE